MTLEGVEHKIVAHSAERWARAVVLFLPSERDATNLSDWGHVIGASRGALRAWCRAAHVSARDSLRFARLLRAVVQSQQRVCDLWNLLDVVDERTLTRLLINAGVAAVMKVEPRPDVATFLAQQRLIRSDLLLAALSQYLKLELASQQRPAATTPGSGRTVQPLGDLTMKA